jgi:hypothetical protein
VFGPSIQVTHWHEGTIKIDKKSRAVGAKSIIELWQAGCKNSLSLLTKCDTLIFDQNTISLLLAIAEQVTW